MAPGFPASWRGRFIRCGLILALIGALGTNAGLFWIAKHYYARELSVRLHPSGGMPVIRSGNPDGTRVLILGDSRAADWPALPSDRFFTINAGVPGETTAQVRLRAEALLLAEKPSVVIFQAGINDLKSIGVFPDAAGEIQRQCASNILEIVKLCQQQNSKVVLTLIIPPGKLTLARRLVWSDKIESSLIQVNNLLEHQLADAKGVAVFSPEKIIGAGGAGRIKSSHYRDTLHLNRTAYLALEGELLGKIQGLLSHGGKEETPLP